MGTNIGQVATSTAVQRPSSTIPTASDPDRRQPDVGTSEAPSVSGITPPSQESTSTTLQAGFGEGTVSSIGAALDALGRSVRYVRDATPTLVEIQSDVRARIAEAQLAAQGAVAPILTARPDRDVVSSVDIQARENVVPQILNGPGESVESRIPEPSAQVQQFAASSAEPAIVPLASTDALEARDEVDRERVQAEPPTPSGPENLGPRLDVLV